MSSRKIRAAEKFAVPEAHPSCDPRRRRDGPVPSPVVERQPQQERSAPAVPEPPPSGAPRRGGAAPVPSRVGNRQPQQKRGPPAAPERVDALHKTDGGSLPEILLSVQARAGNHAALGLVQRVLADPPPS